MLPAILECGIFKVTEGPFDNNKLIAECLICSSPKRVYQASTKQTVSLHKHVKNCHPELQYKIKEKKIEQSQIRRKQRNKKRSIARKLRRIAMEKVEWEE